MASADNPKKLRIIRAAFAVARTHGVKNLTFEAISEEAGLSRQLLRYYFKDSEALMIALCDHLAGLYRQALINGVAGIGDRDRLDFFLDFYFDFLDDHPKPRDDQVYDALFAIAAGSTQVRDNLRNQYGLLGHVISHEIQLKRPDLTAGDGLELSYLFVCLMYGHWKMVATLGFSEQHKHIARQAFDRLVASYTRRPHDAHADIKPWSTDS